MKGKKTKLQMLIDLLPNEVEHPRLESYANSPYASEDMSEDIKALMELQKTDPAYVDRLIDDVNGTNFPIEKTHEILASGKPVTRESLIAAIEAGHPEGFENSFQGEWLAENNPRSQGKSLKDMPMDLVHDSVRNYSSNAITRAHAKYKEELENRRLESVIQGKAPVQKLSDLEAIETQFYRYKKAKPAPMSKEK